MTATLSTPSTAPSRGALGRLSAFADNVFAPKLHIAFAGLWSLSLLGNLHVVSGVSRWQWDAASAVLVGTVFVCLFSLRMIDEIKDYDYDVVHNPDRPLVVGLVTRMDIARYLAIFAVVVLGLNAGLGGALAFWVALDLLYGLAQLPLERRSRAVRENLFVNLVAVYPVNVGLSVYTLLFFLHRTGTPFEAKQAWLVVAYACAFLHFEFARKSGWPHLAQAGERLYSKIVGLFGSLVLSTGFGLAALAIAVGLLAPWAQSGAASALGYLPLAALLPMGAGLVLFARNRARRHAARPPAVAFLFTFYVTMIINALATRDLGWTP